MKEAIDTAVSTLEAPSAIGDIRIVATDPRVVRRVVEAMRTSGGHGRSADTPGYEFLLLS